MLTVKKKKKYLFISFFVLKLPDLNFDGFFTFICAVIFNSVTSMLDGLVFFFVKKVLLYRT